MWSIFEQTVDRNNSNLDVIRCDMHLLDVQFAALLNRCMGDMLDNVWRKGLYRDIPGVIS